MPFAATASCKLHPAALSWRATSSTTRNMVSGSTSRPPNTLGCDMLYSPAWSMASTTGRDRRRFSSASAAYSRIIGAISLTLSNNESAVTFVAIGHPLTSHYSDISQRPLLAQDAHTCKASNSKDPWSLWECLPKHRGVHDDINRVDLIDRELTQSGMFPKQIGVGSFVLAVPLAVLRRVVALDPRDPELVAYG